MGRKIPKLDVYIVSSGIGSLPEYSTTDSACFDIRVGLNPLQSVQAYKRIPGQPNTKEEVFFGRQGNLQGDENALTLELRPGYRYMIPTGLVLCIPNGYFVRLMSRSGSAFREGLVLVNGVGIIDSDYTDPLYVLMTNLGGKRITIRDGDRICQGELVKKQENEIVEVSAKVFEKFVEERQKRSTRRGGVGSTGKG